ncbi:heat stable protein 1 [Tasmannia lanceolata]|uniref:heat stable protein 1 n=1 Tax=Tasmannia lanceolata TaxID=3420 RepID=UPI004064A45D
MSCLGFRERERMEGPKEVVKHLVIAKFKEEIPPERIEELIEGFANLVLLIEPLKTFHWGPNVSIGNLHQGFTHVFESTFESIEDVREYHQHPAHAEFANQILPALDKFMVIDYKYATLNLS